MKSLLYQAGTTPFSDPEGCELEPCRQEVVLTFQKDGRLYRFVLRDKVVPEDPYLAMVKAIAFAIQEGEPYAGSAPGRSVKDFIVKNSLVI